MPNKRHTAFDKSNLSNSICSTVPTHFRVYQQNTHINTHSLTKLSHQAPSSFFFLVFFKLDVLRGTYLNEAFSFAVSWPMLGGGREYRTLKTCALNNWTSSVHLHFNRLGVLWAEHHNTQNRKPDMECRLTHAPFVRFSNGSPRVRPRRLKYRKGFYIYIFIIIFCRLCRRLFSFREHKNMRSTHKYYKAWLSLFFFRKWVRISVCVRWFFFSSRFFVDSLWDKVEDICYPMGLYH